MRKFWNWLIRFFKKRESKPLMKWVEEDKQLTGTWPEPRKDTSEPVHAYGTIDAIERYRASLKQQGFSGNSHQRRIARRKNENKNA